MFKSKEEKDFYDTLDDCEKAVFALFVRCRNAEISPVEAFQQVRDLAMAEEAIQ